MTSQSQNQYIFPQNTLLGYKFTLFNQLLKRLKAESQQKNAEQMSRWFFITGQDEHSTTMTCRAVPTCKAYIKSLYLPNIGFIVKQLGNNHDHRVRDPRQLKIEQLKQHHILSPFLKNFIATKTQKQPIPGPHSITTNCCCKTNPGQTAIAYIITNPSGKIILRSSHKFDQLTSNQAQFIVIMYSLLDSYANGIEEVVVYSRSKLAVGFVTGVNKVSAFNLRDLGEAVKLLVSRLEMRISYRVAFQSCTGLQNVCRKRLGMKEIIGK